MRGVYTAYVRISGVTAAKTLMCVTTAATHVIKILNASVTNESNENNEQMLCTLQRITTLGTPTATTLTPSKTEAGDQASAATVKGNVTASEPTYTASTEEGGEGFSSLGGWFYNPDPLVEAMVIAPSTSVGLRLINAVTSTDLVVRLKYQEIG